MSSLVDLVIITYHKDGMNCVRGIVDGVLLGGCCECFESDGLDASLLKEKVVEC